MTTALLIALIILLAFSMAPLPWGKWRLSPPGGRA